MNDNHRPLLLAVILQRISYGWILETLKKKVQVNQFTKSKNPRTQEQGPLGCPDLEHEGKFKTTKHFPQFCEFTTLILLLNWI